MPNFVRIAPVDMLIYFFKKTTTPTDVCLSLTNRKVYCKPNFSRDDFISRLSGNKLDFFEAML